MKNFLIATKNIDKYQIASALIGKVFDKKFLFQNLNDLGIEHDIIEVGTILERAEQKAKMYWEYLDEVKRNNYIATIGIDDGFSLTESGDGDPNSKELTDKILSGKFIKQNETIWLKRGFAIYNDKGFKSCLTKIPFIFLGNPKNISRQEGVYPLSSVLSSTDKNITIKDMAFDEAIQYYFKYCGKDLAVLFSDILLK